MRRLQVPTSATPGGLVLPAIPRPRDIPGGRCALSRALVAALGAAGHRATYEAILGLSGIAALPPADPANAALDPLWAAYPTLTDQPPGGIPAGWVDPVLRAVGQAGAYCGGLLDPAALVAVVREGLDVGLPVPVLGWPEGEADWSLVTGHDPGRGVLCGWPPGHEATTYLGAPCAGRAAIVLSRAPVSRPSAALSAREALVHWTVERDVTRERYQGWLQWLQTCTETEAPWSHALAEALADARMAAGTFIGTCASVLSEAEPLPELLAAADHLGTLVEVLESVPPLPEGDGDIYAPWREAWSAAVATAYRHEHAAREGIREALEFLSGEPIAGT